MKTSSRLSTSSATPLLPSSSVEPLAKTSSQASEASKPMTTILMPLSYQESLATETSSQTLETSKTVTKSSATPLLLPSFVESLAKTSSQTLETGTFVTRPSATSLLPSRYVESSIKTSSQPPETSKSVTKPPATSLLPPSNVESLAKTSSQALEARKSVTKPPASSLLSPNSVVSFAKTSGQFKESITQAAKSPGTSSAIPTIVKSSANPGNYSMKTRILSSLRAPFAVSSYVGSSSTNGFQTLEITPPSSSVGAPSLGTPSGKSSFKESTRALQSLSTPRELPLATSSSFLHTTSVKASLAQMDSRVLDTSPTRLVAKFSETPFLASSYVKSSTEKRSQELTTTSQDETLLDKSSSRPTNVESSVETDSSVHGGKTVENPTLTESSMLRPMSSTASNIRVTSTTRQVQTHKVIPSVKVSSTFTVGDLQYTSTNPLNVQVSSLRTSNIGSSTDAARSLNLRTKQTQKSAQPTSSLRTTSQSIKDVPVSLITGIQDRETINRGARLKNSRGFSSSVESTKTKTLLIVSYKTEVIHPTVSVESYRNQTSVMEDKKVEVSTATDFESDLVQRSISAESYDSHTSKTMETQVQKTSTPTDFKTTILKPSASVSTDYKQRGSSVVKTSRPVRTTSSLHEHDHVISQSERVTLASRTENVKPSKASESISNLISSDTQTTLVAATTTQAPLLTTAEPHSNETGAIEGTDSPLEGKRNTSLCLCGDISIVGKRKVKSFH